MDFEQLIFIVKTHIAKNIRPMFNIVRYICLDPRSNPTKHVQIVTMSHPVLCYSDIDFM